MGGNESSTAWILGAGFSKSVGGPLLHELLSVRLEASIHEAALQHAHSPGTGATSNALRSLFYGPVARESATPYYDRPWPHDAEAFVAYVSDAAASTGGPATRLLRSKADAVGMLHGQPLDRIARACRNYLALACWQFWADADTSSELWAPYRRWAESLHGSGNTVISFNYDETCELAANSTSHTSHQWLREPRPEAPDDAWRTTSSLFLKLHGSCRWQLESGAPKVGDMEANLKTLVSAFSVPFATTFEYEAAIGVPGPDKLKIAREHLGSLWHAAKARLETANAIVFMGYSLPKTDNDAKLEILQAIGRNKNSRLSVHIVLGTKEVGGGSIDRLVGMLEWSLGDREIHRTPAEARASAIHTKGPHRRALIQVHYMYAEDFLSVYEPKRLDAYRKPE